MAALPSKATHWLGRNLLAAKTVAKRLLYTRLCIVLSNLLLFQNKGCPRRQLSGWVATCRQLVRLQCGMYSGSLPALVGNN